MANYTITITAAEEIALKPVMSNKQTWLENAIQERARISGDSIIADLLLSTGNLLLIKLISLVIFSENKLLVSIIYQSLQKLYLGYQLLLQRPKAYGL